MTSGVNMLTVRIPLTVRRRGGARKMVVPAGVLPMPAQADVTLVKAITRAFRWRRMLETGRYATIDELAAAEKINDSYVSRVLRLTLLAPDVVEAILDGRQPEGTALPALMKPFSTEWKTQRRGLCIRPPDETMFCDRPCDGGHPGRRSRASLPLCDAGGDS